jgi:hypothetical protein
MLMHRKYLVLVSCVVMYSAMPGFAKYTNPNITKQQQSCISRGNSYAKSRQEAKATQAYEAAFATATDVNQCLAIVEGTEKYGSVLNDARRAGLNKALSLATNEQDLLNIAVKSRQNQLYEITKKAVDGVVAKGSTTNDLYELARKAQATALNDVAHMALQRAYSQAKTVDEALAFAKQAKLLGVEDLSQKAIKDIIDDATTTHELCGFLTQIEALGYPDLMRRDLRKALDFATNVDDCKEVFEVARHYDQSDLSNLAAYRGKRMLLMQQVQDNKSAYKDQLEQWRAGKMAEQEQQAAQDMANQQQQQQAPPKPAATGPGF